MASHGAPFNIITPCERERVKQSERERERDRLVRSDVVSRSTALISILLCTLISFFGAVFHGG